MSSIPYTPEQLDELRKIAAPYTSWLEARAAMGRHLKTQPENVTKLHRRHSLWTQPTGAAAVGSTLNGDTFDVNVETSKAATLDEVVALCKVDTAQWESKGFSVRRGANGYAWSARFNKRKVATDLEPVLDHFIKQAEAHAPSFTSVKPIKQKLEGRLLEIGVPDLHLAKLCWAQETGHKDYDIRIAADLYRKAVMSLVDSARAMGISRILLPIGNDLLNSDNAAGETTAGTPQAQSEDSRWKKTYSVACDLITEVIECLALEFPVDVVVVAGNHDHERCFFLGQYMKAWFRNHSNVTVDNGAAQRKYYRFGCTLVGFTHGNEEKINRLPGIMANERRELWAETQYHEWHLGHEHRQMVTEELGVKIRHLPSLCPPDEWMASKGYIGNDQAAEAFIYDPKVGMVATLYFRA